MKTAGFPPPVLNQAQTEIPPSLQTLWFQLLLQSTTPRMGYARMIPQSGPRGNASTSAYKAGCGAPTPRGGCCREVRDETISDRRGKRRFQHLSENQLRCYPP